MGSTAMTTAIPLKKLFSKFYAEGEGALAPCAGMLTPDSVPLGYAVATVLVTL